MRLLVQRVTNASISVNDKKISSIKSGLLVFVGIEDSDSKEDLKWLSNKIVNLRIFNDNEGVPNISLKNTNGDLLLVSQFTLHAAVKKGNRPSYIRASKSEAAITLYEQFIMQLQLDLGKQISTGIFGADMKVELVNDGPVTIFIDSKNKE